MVKKKNKKKKVVQISFKDDGGKSRNPTGGRENVEPESEEGSRSNPNASLTSEEEDVEPDYEVMDRYIAFLR